MVRLLAALALSLGLVQTGAVKALDIHFIDVEGGQSTLIVTPAGQSMLIDAGYASRNGVSRDADRIMAAVREANLDHIDYLLVTHFHADHVGGVPELVNRIPIRTFIDYGEPLGTDRMANNPFKAYEPIRTQHPHIVPKPGDSLPIKGVEAEVVSAAGVLLAKPLPEGGRTNAIACASLEYQTEDGTENFRSIGVRFKFGAFRFLDLGDLSGNTLGKIVCPRNLIGDVSVYLVAHHGNYDSNVPAVLSAVRPRIAILNNGVTKGGAPEAFSTLRRQPGLEDLWQMHASKHPGADNSVDALIANVEGESDGNGLKLTATEDGSFTVLNKRTGFVKTYSAWAVAKGTR